MGFERERKRMRPRTVYFVCEGEVERMEIDKMDKILE